MRIVSKYRDYYDGVGRYDPGARLWVRKTEVITVDRNRLWEVGAAALDALASIPVPPWQLGDACERTLLCFCGRGYGALAVAGATIEEGLTPDRILEFIEGPEANRAEQAHRLVDGLRAQKPTVWDPYPFNPVGWGAWREQHDGLDIGAALHREVDTPVFALRLVGSRYWFKRGRWSPEIVRNPSLRGYAMAARVDPYTAWQEIDMFLGHELARQDDPADAMSDELKRHAKGFDDRSFKRRPGTHPNRKAKKR